MGQFTPRLGAAENTSPLGFQPAGMVVLSIVETIPPFVRGVLACPVYAFVKVGELKFVARTPCPDTIAGGTAARKPNVLHDLTFVHGMKLSQT